MSACFDGFGYLVRGDEVGREEGAEDVGEFSFGAAVFADEKALCLPAPTRSSNGQRVFHELSYADNVAATKLRLAWPDGPSGAPTVTVLTTCLAVRCG